MKNSFATILGYEKEKAELKELQRFLLDAAKYDELGIKIPRGLVMYGSPGVGKTKMSYAIACDGIEVVEVRAADCCNDNASELIQEAFLEAKEKMPAIVLLDELDKIAGTSRRFYMENNDSIQKVLLQELDKLTKNDGILVVATCNDLRCVSDALLRPGRFDRILHIPEPSEADRKKILNKYFSKINLDKNFDIDKVAQLTSGLSGAAIESLVNESAIKAIESGSLSITLDIITQAMNKRAFQSVEGNPIENKYDQNKIAVHEAGHALITLLTKKNTIFGASILPYGENLGHVHLVDDEKRLHDITDIEDRIACALGGRIAERELLGNVSLGASHDLEKAAQMTKKLIVENAAYGYDCVAAIWGHDVSELMMYDIEKKIADKIKLFDARVTQMIRDHRNILDEIIEKLQEKLVLSREDLLEIVDNENNTRTEGD